MDQKNNWYAIDYQEKTFTNMEFLREDEICDRSYWTFKDAFTQEIITVEAEEVKELRKIESPTLQYPA
ncbi:hypothetical protein D1B31_06260 [Neobacillus notoginsengisoli]|uniref:Uncharacterized protein n=1 Tax=Neobacillus notoginsengisoli TaxID=1578198 RepID=A0A417YX93_9BACI|nr:hypothetical protein [Neobacillus notoginsengisoli]RHW42227.1 hypothetical protein D1B31_06260 [Neobacillus notoginsengisoli]